MTVENCLLVTAQSNLTQLPWGLIVDNTPDAVEVCKRRQFSAVFCDYGGLRDRSNGLRLARALRLGSKSLPIYLLSDRPDVAQVQSSLSAGATDLLLRDVVALQRVMVLLEQEVGPNRTLETGHREHLGDATSGVEIKRLEQLLSEAGLGPAAESAINEAIAQLTEKENHAIDLMSIAERVSLHIPDLADRREFMAQYLVTE